MENVAFLQLPGTARLFLVVSIKMPWNTRWETYKKLHSRIFGNQIVTTLFPAVAHCLPGNRNVKKLQLKVPEFGGMK
jgi:hypothetical protein